MWSYTKTTAFILLGTLAVKVAFELSIGANILKSGGAIPAIILAGLALFPVMIIADIIAWRKSRRAPPRLE